MVGVEGSLGSPLKIGGYLGGGYGEVRGGWVTVSGEAGGLVKVEEGEVAIIDVVNDSIASARRAVVGGGRKPRGIMSIEIPHDNRTTTGIQ